LEFNFEPKSSDDQQEAKCWKDANKYILKMVKPSNFHGKDNTTFEDVMSLETFKKLFVEDYKEAKQVKITVVMLWGKAKVWWGQVKADHNACGQQLVNTWA
jgi:hypothetical protein